MCLVASTPPHPGMLIIPPPGGNGGLIVSIPIPLCGLTIRLLTLSILAMSGDTLSIPILTRLRISIPIISILTVSIPIVGIHSVDIPHSRYTYNECTQNKYTYCEGTGTLSVRRSQAGRGIRSRRIFCGTPPWLGASPRAGPAP